MPAGGAVGACGRSCAGGWGRRGLREELCRRGLREELRRRGLRAELRRRGRGTAAPCPPALRRWFPHNLARNFPVNLSNFEFAMAESCGLWGSSRLTPWGITCELWRGVARVARRRGARRGLTRVRGSFVLVHGSSRAR